MMSIGSETLVSIKTLAAITTALVLALPADEARAAETAPSNFSDWGLHCWCLTARHTPQRIVRADNNGRVLQLAVGGITRADLDRELRHVSESQLILLQSYGLLTHDGERYITTFPIFGPETIGPMRARLAALASRTTPALRADVQTIVASARAQGHPGSAYAMVFGYALDGTLWDELKRRGFLPDTVIDLDHPFWRGAFWAIYPERSGAPGRNDVALGGRTLVGIWTDRTVAALNARLDAARAAGSGVDLADLPAVVDRPDDPVHGAGHKIAATLATALLDSDAGRALLAQFPERLRQQALLALAHEFIWSVLDELVMANVVQLPGGQSAQQPTDAELMDLMFVVSEGAAR